MRLDQLYESTLTDEQRTLYTSIAGNREGVDARPRHLVDAEGAIQGPFNHMLHVPAIGDPLQQLGGVLRFRGALSDAARELAILLVARSQRSEFEWWAHVPIARRAGVTDDQLDALLAGPPPTFDDPVTDCVVTTTTALVERGDLTDEEYARAEHVLGAPTLIELTTLVGYYALVAMQLRVFRVTIPDGETNPFSR
ncbi:MAG TPA: carboxymuconolactone decarboxylase family protein [Acidimicrobiia bacterium]|nr:carboxymuconolactone decarboxylase family protein [Acidimicrobiia bacterium]